jgi:hypothetical protein
MLRRGTQESAFGMARLKAEVCGVALQKACPCRVMQIEQSVGEAGTCEQFRKNAGPGRQLGILSLIYNLHSNTTKEIHGYSSDHRRIRSRTEPA